MPSIFHLSIKNSLCIICGGVKDLSSVYHFTTLPKSNKHRLKYDSDYVPPVRHACNLCEAAIATGLLCWSYGVGEASHFVPVDKPAKHKQMRLDKDSPNFTFKDCPEQHKFWQFLHVANNWSQEAAVSLLSHIEFEKVGDKHVVKRKLPAQETAGSSGSH